MTTLSSLIIDVDGTVAPLKRDGEPYNTQPPDAAVLERMIHYEKAGFRIVLFSSRGMRTYSGNLSQINQHVRPPLESWLSAHNVPYDELILGKPWPGPEGFYVDDRCVRPEEFTALDFAGIRALLHGEDPEESTASGR